MNEESDQDQQEQNQQERTFAYYEENYAEYLNSLDDKKRLAHRVAFEVLGTSYQLPYTMDYLEYKKKKDASTPAPPEQEPREEEPRKPKVRKIKRIKRKNIKPRPN
jgi:ABC-type Zn uptake system ZnuABC Zn-binding protein ZnuA